MEYFYRFSRLPGQGDLKAIINQAASRLDQKLKNLDLKRLGLSEYMQRYLGNYQRNLRGILQINAYLLFWSLAERKEELQDLTFVDYGGGPGVLSFLAKELGIGTVIYNDIYDVSCHDARQVGEAIGSSADGYVWGDIDALKEYVETRSQQVDIIASYDVIEHIYDTEGYFRSLRLLPHHNLRIVFASSANAHNPLIRRSRQKSHHVMEYQDRQTHWGRKERDTLEGYLRVRAKIIAARAPQLGQSQVETLARMTRGLVQRDIEKCVDEYLTVGRISYQPSHATNTCDPYTGNWDERLMDTRWISDVFASEGFKVQVKSGYYAFAPHPLVNAIKSALNLGISGLGGNILTFSPYYVIYANRSS